MRIITRPIERWPGALLSNAERQTSPFRATWADTKQLLTHEAEQLGADDIVLQLALTEDDIRLDGWPRAHAKPTHPGVIVSIETDQGPLSFPCDRFLGRYYDDEDWHANVRAIALAMEALRKVDRYGITRNGEQYVGWRAIEGGDGSPTSAEASARVLLTWGLDREFTDNDVELVIRDPAYRSQRYKQAAMATHPDRGGNADDFRAVQLALEVLNR